jgi:glucokinase
LIWAVPILKLHLYTINKGFILTTSIPTNAEMGKKYVFDRIAMAVNDLVEQHDEKPIGIGMGLPGMVSYEPENRKKSPEPARMEGGKCSGRARAAGPI